LYHALLNNISTCSLSFSFINVFIQLSTVLTDESVTVLQGNGHQFSNRGEYTVYSTFQSHEPEFDYLKSLEIEEKINKIRWLQRTNPANFLLSTNGKHACYS